MKRIIRNILAVIIGALIGGITNSVIIYLAPSLIEYPAGVDTTTVEGLKAAADSLTAKHYLFAFLAHALGTFVGGFFAALLGVKKEALLALIVGGFFLIGGIVASFMIPAPIWFIFLDLLLAYLPMAWLGYKIKISIINNKMG